MLPTVRRMPSGPAKKGAWRSGVLDFIPFSSIILARSGTRKVAAGKLGGRNVAAAFGARQRASLRLACKLAYLSPFLVARRNGLYDNSKVETFFVVVNSIEENQRAALKQRRKHGGEQSGKDHGSENMNGRETAQRDRAK